MESPFLPWGFLGVQGVQLQVRALHPEGWKFIENGCKLAPPKEQYAPDCTFRVQNGSWHATWDWTLEGAGINDILKDCSCILIYKFENRQLSWRLTELLKELWLNHHGHAGEWKNNPFPELSTVIILEIPFIWHWLPSWTSVLNSSICTWKSCEDIQCNLYMRFPV